MDARYVIHHVLKLEDFERYTLLMVLLASFTDEELETIRECGRGERSESIGPLDQAIFRSVAGAALLAREVAAQHKNT